MSLFIDLRSTLTSAPSNATVGCGLVTRIPDENGRPPLAALQGHADSTICVFEQKSRALMRSLVTGQSVRWTENLFNWVRGVSYAALAVSLRPKRVRFTANFHCANVPLINVVVTLDITTDTPEQVAADVFHNSDPVFSLCESLKSRLGRHLNTVTLANIRGLPDFRNQVYQAFDRLDIDLTQTLRILSKEIAFDAPKTIVEADNARFRHQASMEGERARVQLQTVELDAAGVTDPQLRLTLTNLTTRATTLQELLRARIEHNSRRDERKEQILQSKLEMVRRFLGGRLTDQTPLQEVEGLLQMLDSAAAADAAHSGFVIVEPAVAARPEQIGDVSESRSLGAGITRFRVVEAGQSLEERRSSNRIESNAAVEAAPEPRSAHISTQEPEAPPRKPRFSPRAENEDTD